MTSVHRITRPFERVPVSQMRRLLRAVVAFAVEALDPDWARSKQAEGRLIASAGRSFENLRRLAKHTNWKGEKRNKRSLTLPLPISPKPSDRLVHVKPVMP